MLQYYAEVDGVIDSPVMVLSDTLHGERPSGIVYIHITGTLPSAVVCVHEGSKPTVGTIDEVKAPPGATYSAPLKPSCVSGANPPQLFTKKSGKMSQPQIRSAANRRERLAVLQARAAAHRRMISEEARQRNITSVADKKRRSEARAIELGNKARYISEYRRAHAPARAPTTRRTKGAYL